MKDVSKLWESSRDDMKIIFDGGDLWQCFHSMIKALFARSLNSV